MKEDNSRHEITVKTLEQSDWEAELEEKTLDSQEEVGSCCHKTSDSYCSNSPRQTHQRL